MKAITIFLVIILGGIFAFSPVVSATATTNNIFSKGCSGTAATTQVCKGITTPSKSNPIINILRTTITVIAYILGIAAIVVLIIAGLQMIINGSDPQAVATARNTLLYALVGLVVAALAQTIVIFVLDKIK